MKINMLDINSFDSDNFFIQPNDIVYVAPLKAKILGYRNLRNANHHLINSRVVFSYNHHLVGKHFIEIL